MRLRKNSVAEFVIISRDGNQQLPYGLAAFGWWLRVGVFGDWRNGLW